MDKTDENGRRPVQSEPQILAGQEIEGGVIECVKANGDEQVAEHPAADVEEGTAGHDDEYDRQASTATDMITT